MQSRVAAWSSWEAATPRSRELFQRASRVLPGGMLSPVRGASAFEPYPIYMDHGEGAYLFDVDGNRYLDLMLGLGPIILGHNPPSVVKAVSDQVGQGSLYPSLYRLERQGYIASEWGVTENNRQARFYRLTGSGRKRLAEERADWARMSRAVDLVLRMGEG